ncbi:imidazole glycerol phosphate synthase subunit HisF [bacterium]|nr:imidazole glycerol phosphate synthase subunit HisF [bacterium]
MEHLSLSRVIPVLLIDKGKLVKTTKFKNPNYIGDPVNAVKIFNDKEVDEVVLLDITATKEQREPDYDKIEEICSEAFMPFAYGGGINSLDQVDRLFQLGIEKVVLNSTLNSNLGLVKQISEKYGAQSVMASIDVKKSLFGRYTAYSHSGQKKIKQPIQNYLQSILDAGVGEVFLNSIDRDGTFSGYDLELIGQFSKIAAVPIVACGGARSLDDFKWAINSGASAVAAGSLFVYRGVQKGILINYPTQLELRSKVY